MKTQTFPITGMHCASCAQLITKKLQKLPGVTNVSVNYATEQATVTFNTTQTSTTIMNQTIRPLGYTLTDTNTETNLQHHSPAHAPLISLLFVGIALATMTWELGEGIIFFIPPMPRVYEEFFHHLMPILATIMLFTIGIQYLTAIGRFIRYRIANMDTLVGIGTLTAFFYSFVVSAFEIPLTPYINTTHTYYDVTIVVIGFITIGKYLESQAKRHTSDAVKKLIGLSAKTATVVRNGTEEEIPIDQVLVGDMLIVKPGSKIPVDGVVVSGSSTVDESMITGESFPVDKTTSHKVIGATINKHGLLTIKATSVGSQTMLSQIMKLVADAQGSKAPIERLADKVSSIFVPIVLALAIVVFALWFSVGSQFLPISQAFTQGLLAFVGILVIACPCAMGLATPTAIIAAVGKAAQNGILIKNAESLEKAHAITHVVFDKTGTLTQGKPAVTDMVYAQALPFSQDYLHNLIFTLANGSDHPLSVSLVRYLNKVSNLSNGEIRDFNNHPGQGITAKIDNHAVAMGNAKLLQTLGISLAENQQGTTDTFSREGKTIVFVAVDTQILALIALADTLKEHAQTVIANLKKNGIDVWMITGDNSQTAQAIAQQAGIDHILADVLPADKAQKIKDLKKSNQQPPTNNAQPTIAFVGDGINDAPALATADIGIAMGTGTDIAIESASITLLGGNLTKVLQTLTLAKKTMAIVKQNLFWAFFYNAVSIPVAAGALYPFFGIMLSPAIAGAAMAFSSVSVVANSLRLKTMKI